MFSKLPCFALLTLALLAEAAPGDANRSAFRKGAGAGKGTGAGGAQSQCAAPSTVTRTITVGPGFIASSSGAVAAPTTTSKAATTTTSKAATATTSKATTTTTSKAVETTPAQGSTNSLSPSKGATSTSTGNNAAPTNGGGTAADGDPQKSLTLDPRVIGAAFAQNGVNVANPDPGRVASLTSTNNFINYCLTTGLTITDGKQNTAGSCNPIPIGSIPAKTNMPSSKFINPPNLGTLKENTAFTIEMAIRGLQTGNFVNPDTNYFAAPQQLNAQGIIIGHSHVVIEKIESMSQTTPTDPTKFQFFKGLNNAAAGGKLSTVVDKGLPAGVYRMSSINAASNHQPVIVPVAQHGSLDDVVYFTVTASGQPAAGDGTNVVAPGAGAGTSSAPANGATTTSKAATPTSTSKSPVVTTSTPVRGGAGNNGGRGGGRGNGGRGGGRRSLNRLA